MRTLSGADEGGGLGAAARGAAAHTLHCDGLMVDALERSLATVLQHRDVSILLPSISSNRRIEFYTISASQGLIMHAQLI